MGGSPLVFETIFAFVIAAGVLFHYGNWYKHHVIVTVSVLIAWYFSMLIVFVLPIDVSNTIYENSKEKPELLLSVLAPNTNSSLDASSQYAKNSSIIGNLSFVLCHKPWSYVSPEVFPIFWRIVYWTSQFLTWLILPMMQSYTKAGDFTVAAKLKSALIDNAIYYGSYLLIVGILLLYIALQPDLYLDGSKLRVIAATASNTWGLFWLVLLLGYGLVEVPRSLWHCSSILYVLNNAYFRAAKLSQERAETEDHLNHVLQSIKAISSNIGQNHRLCRLIDIIENKIPLELTNKTNQASSPESPYCEAPSEKALVKLHRQLLKVLQQHKRIETQWMFLKEKILESEDIYKNSLSAERIFKRSNQSSGGKQLFRSLFSTKIEWYWHCLIKKYLLRAIAVVFSIISVVVIWSELTLFSEHPPLSLFAILVNLAKSNCRFLTIEVISTLSMAYISFCAYSTLFKIRVLNLYYLAPHHQTDEYSLIFAGMILCRLTPPMCLNFLSLIHMDSHIIKSQEDETAYTQVMGHMDVIPIINDGFNIYFPMMIVALCLATYYSLGSRLLSSLGFQQFIGGDDLTTDLIDEGKALIGREVRRHHRELSTFTRRKEFAERYGKGESTTEFYRSARERVETFARPLKREDSASSHVELLGGGGGTCDYSTNEDLNEQDNFTSQITRSRQQQQAPDKDIFNDV